MTRTLAILLVATLFRLSAQAQNPAPVSNPQALALARQAILTLTGSSSISDVTLKGTAVWSNGSASEKVGATLMAKGTGESRFDMALSAGPRSEIRNDSSADVQGEVLMPDKSVLRWGLDNCLVNAVWFFPHLSVLGAAAAGDSTRIFSYIGQEVSRSGTPIHHIRSYRYSPTGTDSVQRLSTMDIYLDAASYVPIAFVFIIHPEDGWGPDLWVEVDFSNYQSVNGILVPFRIQRYVDGSLGLDFSATSAQFNSGLPDSLFATN